MHFVEFPSLCVEGGALHVGSVSGIGRKHEPRQLFVTWPTRNGRRIIRFRHPPAGYDGKGQRSSRVSRKREKLAKAR